MSFHKKFDKYWIRELNNNRSLIDPPKDLKISMVRVVNRIGTVDEVWIYDQMTLGYPSFLEIAPQIAPQELNYNQNYFDIEISDLILKNN
jgi:hypothetical protein